MNYSISMILTDSLINNMDDTIDALFENWKWWKES